ncbi:MAG: hypothetical protein KAR79_05635, partial [Simkaniaceae bacterium]|nr:hypothetical protein [Simkaniaceae bacterium]
IFDSFEECIKFETYNKLYLHQENIHLTKNGPVLQLKSKSLPLPNLQLDEDGPYISDSEIIQQTSIVKCIRCGWSRFSGEYCNNPACPLSKK